LETSRTRTADSLYISLLERVNEQVSLSANPMAVLVSALGVLFTIGGIITAIALWRQSSDFRNQRDQTLREAGKQVEAALAAMRQEGDKWITEAKAILTTILEETKGQNELLQAELTNKINEATARADKTSGEAKREVQQEIKRLKALRQSLSEKAATTPSVGTSIGLSIGSPTVSGGMKPGIMRPGVIMMNSAVSSFGTLLNHSQACRKCARRFEIPTSGNVSIFGQAIECPYCGEVQSVS
jgi:hypothetical protein